MGRQLKLATRRRRPLRKRTYRRRARTRTSRAAKTVNVKKDIHYFKRFTYKSTITGDVSRVAKGALTFKLDDVPGLSDFTSLFDYYKITGVQLKFTTYLDPNSQAAGNAYYPKMYSTIDLDDDSAPLSSDDLRQRQSCKIRWLAPNRSYNFFLRPRYLKNVYISGVANGYELGRNQWLDLSNTNVPHYGFKYVIENLNPDLSQAVQVEACYYLAFRGVR